MLNNAKAYEEEQESILQRKKYVYKKLKQALLDENTELAQQYGLELAQAGLQNCKCRRKNCMAGYFIRTAWETLHQPEMDPQYLLNQTLAGVAGIVKQQNNDLANLLLSPQFMDQLAKAELRRHKMIREWEWDHNPAVISWRWLVKSTRNIWVGLRTPFDIAYAAWNWESIDNTLTHQAKICLEQNQHLQTAAQSLSSFLGVQVSVYTTYTMKSPLEIKFDLLMRQPINTRRGYNLGKRMQSVRKSFQAKKWAEGWKNLKIWINNPDLTPYTDPSPVRRPDPADPI